MLDYLDTMIWISKGPRMDSFMLVPEVLQGHMGNSEFEDSSKSFYIQRSSHILWAEPMKAASGSPEACPLPPALALSYCNYRHLMDLSI